MEIVINNTNIEVFEGATVFDAINVYNTQRGKRNGWRSVMVFDEQNHSISLKGELTSGDKLKIILQ